MTIVIFGKELVQKSSVSEFRRSGFVSDKNIEHQECRNRDMRNRGMI
jgi:hypothetical protein